MKIRLKSRLFITRLLVLGSMAASIMSYFTVKEGLGEIYPFFYWKLYTQPLGSAHTHGEYRIYYKNKGEYHWTRESISPAATFTEDEYVHTFTYLTNKTLNAAPPDTLPAFQLLSFIRHVAPAADAYKVVREKYDPKQLLDNDTAYDTTTVISF